MRTRAQVALIDPAEWLGAWHPLAEQLGSADGLLELGSVSTLLRLTPVRNLASFLHFLKKYQSEVLVPLELPAIQSAYGHAARHEVRELIALDGRLAGEPLLLNFADASRRVGQNQLRKLRPLRDERLLQRYLEAVEAGHAHGWHTLVYGVTMAVYSLPLRQGLLGYAQQVMRGFIYSAAGTLRLSEKDCRSLFDRMCEDMPWVVEGLLRETAAARP